MSDLSGWGRIAGGSVLNPSDACTDWGRAFISETSGVITHSAKITALYGDLVATDFSELGRNHRFRHDRRQSLDVGASSRSSPISLVDLGRGASHGMPGCRRADGPAESSPVEFPGASSRCAWAGEGIRRGLV